MYKKILAVIILITLSGNAFPAQNCRGTIDYLYVHRNGDVVLFGSWAADYTNICNMNTEWKSVSAGTCKGWLSIALTAKASKLDVRLRYTEANAPACNAIPSYTNAPSPGYIMLDR